MGDLTKRLENLERRLTRQARPAVDIGRLAGALVRAFDRSRAAGYLNENGEIAPGLAMNKERSLAILAGLLVKGEL